MSHVFCSEENAIGLQMSNVLKCSNVSVSKVLRLLITSVKFIFSFQPAAYLTKEAPKGLIGYLILERNSSYIL